jgi:hypothetical protein
MKNATWLAILAALTLACATAPDLSVEHGVALLDYGHFSKVYPDYTLNYNLFDGEPYLYIYITEKNELGFASSFRVIQVSQQDGRWRSYEQDEITYHWENQRVKKVSYYGWAHVDVNWAGSRLKSIDLYYEGELEDQYLYQYTGDLLTSISSSYTDDLGNIKKVKTTLSYDGDLVNSLTSSENGEIVHEEILTYDGSGRLIKTEAANDYGYFFMSLGTNPRTS